MCNPLAMTVLMGAQLGIETLGQKQKYDANVANAQQAMYAQNKQTNIAIQQGEAASGVKAQDAQTEMLKAAATAKASANETGVSGNSVDALINDYHASEGRYLNSLDQQGSWDRSQADVQKLGQKAQAQRQINSVAAPDYIGAALRVGAQGFDTYRKMNGPNATR